MHFLFTAMAGLLFSLATWAQEGRPLRITVHQEGVEVDYSDGGHSGQGGPLILESHSQANDPALGQMGQVRSQSHAPGQEGGGGNNLCGLDPSITQGGPAQVGTCAGAANECTSNYGLLVEAQRDVGAAGYADEKEYNFCKRYDCRSRYFKICSAIELGYEGEMISPEERRRSCMAKGLLSQPQCASAAASLMQNLQAISTIATDPAPSSEEVKVYHVSKEKMPTIGDCQKSVAKCKSNYEAELQENASVRNDAEEYDLCARDFRNEFHITFGAMCNDAALRFALP